jgi:cell division septum initiation protein DivIVA
MSDDLEVRVELLEEQMVDAKDRIEALETQVQEQESRLDRVGQAYVAVDKLRGQIETLQKLVYENEIKS